MTIRYVAFDPGGSTGWATYTANQITDPETREVEWKGTFQIGTLESSMHHLELFRLLEAFKIGMQDYRVITESFEYRNDSRPGLELISRNYIGVIELYCQMYNVTYVKQTASMGKGFVKDLNIQRLNLWTGGKRARHSMDALRHLLYYLIHTNGDPKQRLALLEKGWR